LTVILSAAKDLLVETTLHRQLKEIYAVDDARTEVPWGKYRIDVVVGDLLIEIQHASLAGIRDKVRHLLNDHQVLVVKPVVVRKLLVKRSRKKGRVVDRRLSPKRGTMLDLFDELIYFTRVFPHDNLMLDVALVDVEEWRYPGHGRRRRRRANDHVVEDQRLTCLHELRRFRQAEDLTRLLPPSLPRPFHTGHLAEGLQVERWIAQRIAYCLRKMGAVHQVGKQGNARLYEIPTAGQAGHAA
jgi:hypothetical protein